MDVKAKQPTGAIVVPLLASNRILSLGMGFLMSEPDIFVRLRCDDWGVVFSSLGSCLCNAVSLDFQSELRESASRYVVLAWGMRQ